MSENTASWDEIRAWEAKATKAAMDAYRASLKTEEAREEATYEDLRRVQPQPEVLRLVPADLLSPERWEPYTCRESSKDYGHNTNRDDSEAPRPFTAIEQLRKRKEWRGVKFGTAPTMQTERHISAVLQLGRDERKAITIPEETFEVIGFEMGAGEARFGRHRFSGSIRLVTGKDLNALRVEAWRTREAGSVAVREAQRAKEEAEREAANRERMRRMPYIEARLAATQAQSRVSLLEVEVHQLAETMTRTEQALMDARFAREAAFKRKHEIAAALGIDPETGDPLPKRDS